MARRVNKTVQVNKFGGVQSLGETEMHGYGHDIKDIEVESKTKLEQDEGYGNAAIIRCFEFGANPEAFKEYQPTRQELFNSHHKGIETALWRDGMKVMPDVNPRIVMDQKTGRYRIFVGAQPMKGHILHERPQTLSEIAHGRSTY